MIARLTESGEPGKVPSMKLKTNLCWDKGQENLDRLTAEMYQLYQSLANVLNTPNKEVYRTEMK